jgi:hypothetical protein
MSIGIVPPIALPVPRVAPTTAESLHRRDCLRAATSGAVLAFIALGFLPGSSAIH